MEKLNEVVEFCKNMIGIMEQEREEDVKSTEIDTGIIMGYDSVIRFIEIMKEENND